MGTEDMRRQEPNKRQRMRLLGAVRGVDAGARTLKEAVSAAIDWVANVASTHYVIGSVRRTGALSGARGGDLLMCRIGDEAREQLHRPGRQGRPTAPSPALAAY